MTPPRPHRDPSKRVKRECADCCVSLAHEGGVKAWGLLFCSEECADAWEADSVRTTYAEDPLGGSWS
jgi:hypothetical protein